MLSPTAHINGYFYLFLWYWSLNLELCAARQVLHCWVLFHSPKSQYFEVFPDIFNLNIKVSGYQQLNTMPCVFTHLDSSSYDVFAGLLPIFLIVICVFALVCESSLYYYSNNLFFAFFPLRAEPEQEYSLAIALLVVKVPANRKQSRRDPSQTMQHWAGGH